MPRSRKSSSGRKSRKKSMKKIGKKSSRFAAAEAFFTSDIINKIVSVKDTNLLLDQLARIDRHPADIEYENKYSSLLTKLVTKLSENEILQLYRIIFDQYPDMLERLNIQRQNYLAERLYNSDFHNLLSFLTSRGLKSCGNIMEVYLRHGDIRRAMQLYKSGCAYERFPDVSPYILTEMEREIRREKSKEKENLQLAMALFQQNGDPRFDSRLMDPHLYRVIGKYMAPFEK